MSNAFILSLVAVAPVALGFLLYAYRALPAAEASLSARSGEAG